MRFGKLALCGALLWGGPAQAQDAPVQNSVRLVRLISGLAAGTPTMRLGVDAGIFGCFNRTITQTSPGERREPPSLAPFAASFKSELERAGYKVFTPGQDNLFDPESGAADLQVAAVITSHLIEGCVSQGNLFSNPGDIKGTGTMSIDWQIYSPTTKQVLARPRTSGSVTLEKTAPDGANRLLNESFAANVRDLASNAEFRAAVNAPRPLAKGTVLPSQQSKIGLTGSLEAGKRQVSDAVGSVVTILNGSSSGSGDLVSSDGYMLTNYHVVGDAKQVRVRWSDGIETVADVVRVSKPRDIALIKTNPRDREPLAIKRGTVSPGQRVYAIGSPLGKEYQGTVSSGIISATRTMDGMRYIQSDVAISHGSSGGALLDENGAVIGITVSGVDPGVASGLHFFIPIGDALDFLNLEQQ